MNEHVYEHIWKHMVVARRLDCVLEPQMLRFLLNDGTSNWMKILGREGKSKFGDFLCGRPVALYPRFVETVCGMCTRKVLLNIQDSWWNITQWHMRTKSGPLGAALIWLNFPWCLSLLIYKLMIMSQPISLYLSLCISQLEQAWSTFTYIE